MSNSVMLVVCRHCNHRMTFEPKALEQYGNVGDMAGLGWLTQHMQRTACRQKEVAGKRRLQAISPRRAPLLRCFSRPPKCVSLARRRRWNSCASSSARCRPRTGPRAHNRGPGSHTQAAACSSRRLMTALNFSKSAGGIMKALIRSCPSSVLRRRNSCDGTS
jgi:hypothetical protein